jgi:BirA family biotin operon repressor/biotin-[acetyl-CoA-carboxylase] ligase
VDAADHVRPPGAEPAHPPAPGGWPTGWRVLRIDETGSTNDDLLASADRLDDRTVLFAGHQTAGRGRLDRRWEAPPDANLLVSILFRTVPDDPGELTRRVGLAVVDTVRSIAAGPVRCALKWPNDVLLDGSKVAGILAQRDGRGSVVVGCGLNIGWAPDGAARIADVVDGSETACPTPAEVLDTLLRCFDALAADITDRYRSDLDTLGRRVRVERPDGDVEGIAVDVEPTGLLVVLDDCAITHRVDVGDIVHLRTADPTGDVRADGT